ncbi:MAG: RNA-directed DNA polymerase, partial [Bacteroidetes bacterium]|nr:RNA-directed DNA polymerase [Bacteroidota bacterium]
PISLNSITVKDRYPLPLIEDIFDQLGGSKVFTTLDLRSSYWQMPIHESSIHKTAFCSFRGLYEYMRLPFGLQNAPSAFSRAITGVLGENIGKICFVFIDDVVIFSKNENEHKKHVDLILKRLDDHDLTLKECKCHWAQKKIDLLGYVVCEKGISAQPAKTDAISKLTP